MARLVATKGPAAGKSFPLADVVTLGRSLEVDIRLDDRTVSREHARLLMDPSGDYTIQDLQSGNGTFVNGSIVDRRKLSEGDEIRLGSNVLVFHGTPHPPAAVAAAEKTMIQIPESDSTVVNTIDVDSGSASIPISDHTTIEELASANRRLQIVCEMFRSIGTDLNEEPLLDKILDTLFRVFPDTHRGFIILRDPRTGALTPGAKKTITENIDDRLAMSDAILQYVLNKRHAVLSRDAMHDGRFTGSQSIADLKVRSVMCAPLKHEDSILGFVAVDTQKVSRQYNEEGLALLAGIANQASLSIANARLHAELVGRERIEQDLRNARDIQHSFLPQQLPDVEGYEFADWYTSAHEVGGDFYDFIQLPDGKLGIVVGDVSGKGITAALMMAKMTGHVRFNAAAGLSPGQLLAALNKAISASATEVFVTVLFMVLDPVQHTLLIGNAGHLPPLVRRADGTVESLERTSGFPIGITEEAEFPECSVRIQPHDRVCAFTDGLTEAMNKDKEVYGEERFMEALRNASLAPAAMVEKIQKSVREYTGDAEQSDDLTLVCFGPSQSGKP